MSDKPDQNPQKPTKPGEITRPGGFLAYLIALDDLTRRIRNERHNPPELPAHVQQRINQTRREHSDQLEPVDAARAHVQHADGEQPCGPIDCPEYRDGLLDGFDTCWQLIRDTIGR